jgi:hypothetical protein
MRKFLDTVRSEMATKLADNTAGEISALDIREVLADIIDSTISDEAGYASSTSPILSMALTTTWRPLTDANVTGGVVFDTAVGGDGDFLRMLPSVSGIQSSPIDGWSYNAKGAIDIDAPTNVPIEVAIGADGVPGTLVQTVIGTAGVNFWGTYLERYLLSTPADTIFQILLRSPTGPTTASISNRTLGLIILPTNNP